MYFYLRMLETVSEKYAQVRATISLLFEDSYRRYGYRRIDGALRRESVRLSEKVVRPLIAEEPRIVKTPRRRRYCTYAGDPTPPAPSLLNRDYPTSAPNTKSLTNLTYIHIPAGKVYVPPTVDWLVVAWNIGSSPDAKLVNTVLDFAVETLKPGERAIIHLDRGSHYRWPVWTRSTDNAKLSRWMSRKGRSHDNAACEGFFGRLKNELIYPRIWPDATLEGFMRHIDAYIRWYNEPRLKSRWAIVALSNTATLRA